MTRLTNKYWAVQVPLSSKKHHISFTGKKATSNDQSIFFKHKDESELDEWTSRDLPPGNYRFLFTTATATEEDARKVVEEDKRGFKYYWNDKGFVPRGFNSRYKTALESLTSLLRSKNLDPDKNYTLIEKLSSDE